MVNIDKPNNRTLGLKDIDGWGDIPAIIHDAVEQCKKEGTVARLGEHIKVTQIIVYGSVARGEAIKGESDIDIIAITNADTTIEAKILEECARSIIEERDTRIHKYVEPISVVFLAKEKPWQFILPFIFNTREGNYEPCAYYFGDRYVTCDPDIHIEKFQQSMSFYPQDAIDTIDSLGVGEEKRQMYREMVFERR